MKILLINWSWYPTGGDWTYVENIHKLYESHGHEVIPFSTHNKKNVFSSFSKNFVSSYDFKELNKSKTINNGIKAIRTSVVSSDALYKLDRVLNEHDIQVAHLHNIHHYITPAIVEKLHKKGIKILWTLHDYKIICPENSFVSNGKLCEKCMDGSFYHCALNRCKKNSVLASALASFEAYYYHKKKTYQLVDCYLCPSVFIMEKFKQFGFDAKKLFLTNSCYDISRIDTFIEQHTNFVTQTGNDKFILYVGRLEDIKGVKTLIMAVKDTGIKLKIAGMGNAQEEIHSLVTRENISNVEMLGLINKNEVFELTQKAAFGVCPSEWYENFPFSISETFLFSKPVVGSNIGGIPELVIDGKTGLLFEAGNIPEMRSRLLQLWNDETLTSLMGVHARVHAYDLYNYKNHWDKIAPCLPNNGSIPGTLHK